MECGGQKPGGRTNKNFDVLEMKEQELGTVLRVWSEQSESGRFWEPTDTRSRFCRALLIVSCARAWATTKNKADLPVLTRLTALGKTDRQTDRSSS